MRNAWKHLQVERRQGLQRMRTHVTLRLSYVDEKEEKVEEALVKSETRDDEAYVKGNAEK
jgi:hypothetical protein